MKIRFVLVVLVVLSFACDFESWLPYPTMTTPPTMTTLVTVSDNTPQPTLEILTVTAVQALNIRSGPGKQYPTVRDEPLPNGASLVSLGNCQHTDSGWWLKIRYDDLEGYVNQKYVSEQVCK